MAQLSSPGVSVTVIDESFYTPAAPGTVPLIVVASEESKQNGAGTGTAPGTLAANAGQVYLMTSQKDLSDTFGTPVFKTDANNNPIHAGEQNEYGLQAAYSLLGVSNRAYVVRADINLAELNASATAPAGSPANGSFWLDTAATKFGIFEWNSAAANVTGGQTFTVKFPTVITDVAKLDNEDAEDKPKNSVGAVGDYAIVATTTLNRLFFKKGNTGSSGAPTGTWVEVGSTDWASSWPTVQCTVSNPTVEVTDTITINGEAVTNAGSVGALATAINTKAIAGVTAAAVNSKLEIYSTGVDVIVSASPAGDGGLAERLGLTVGTYKAPALAIAPHTQVPLFKRADNALTVNGNATGSIWVKTTTPNLGAEWIVKKYNTTTGAWAEVAAPIYKDAATALSALSPTGATLAIGSLYVKYNDDEVSPELANFKVYGRKNVGDTAITSVLSAIASIGSGTYNYTISESIVGSSVMTDPLTVSFTIPTPGLGDPAITEAQKADAFVAALSAALVNTTKTVNAVTTSVTSSIVAVRDTSTNQVTISHSAGGEIKFVDGTGTPIKNMFGNPYAPVSTAVTNFYGHPAQLADNYVASLWTELSYQAAADAPTSIPVDGRLWYNSIVDEVDIMIHNGTTWVGYKNYDHAAGIPNGEPTDANGPIISATKPTAQTNGLELANGDLWIDTSDLENYPTIYKYDLLNTKWVLVDTSDQSTENGILFRDARAGTSGGTAATATDAAIAPSGTIKQLLESNYLDFDAPDPALYPKGMLLWNLRRSGFNVKRFAQSYVDSLARNLRFDATNSPLGQDVALGQSMATYYPHRWVSEAANQENGAGTFGRKAQRKVVVQALQALVNSNQQIRDEESRVFNLIACPGYPELVGELVSLNFDRGLTAFVVADTPARLTPDATSLSNWGNNVNGALEDNDVGLVSSDEYLGFFYPWGYTSDNVGNNVVVPPSHMMLRTIALSDNVSYPWFAPAGTRRGGITNATSVGYIDAEGEFQSVALNNGQRDTLASIKVNPITFITGTGYVNYGQYTRAKNASALDRINVARLVIYLRRQFAQLAKPYVFEPNDKITRDEIKNAAESLLLELVGQRALYDYLVVCDTSNNTPARIDRNELYLDVAIEPVKAVEFIYIPLRLKNTGEIKGLQ